MEGRHAPRLVGVAGGWWWRAEGVERRSRGEAGSAGLIRKEVVGAKGRHMPKI